MNNKLILNNYLLILKSTVEVYIHGTLESYNDDVRKILKYGLDETINSQAITYDLMNEYGWYEVNNVKTSSINQTLNKISQNN